jgi:hypothetical protein
MREGSVCMVSSDGNRARFALDPADSNGLLLCVLTISEQQLANYVRHGIKI